MPATPRGPMADGKAAEEAKARPSPGTSRKVLLKRRASKINSAQFVSKAQCDDAMRVYEELRQLDPSDVAAHTGKGDCCRMLHDQLGASPPSVPRCRLRPAPPRLTGARGWGQALSTRTWRRWSVTRTTRRRCTAVRW